MPVIIGLTGNIATGKSAVAKILTEKGALVIDADKVAHDVMQPDGPAYQGVVDVFGPGILAIDGAIDRGRLGAIVFSDGNALQRLEAIVHPAVLAEVDRRIAEATQSVIVVEAIKLIEAGMNRRYDALWVVTAPRLVQIERLMTSRDLSEEEAALRVDAQSPQEEKAARADCIIVNDRDMKGLRAKVEEAWAQFWVGQNHVRWEARSSPESVGAGRGRALDGELEVRRARREDLASIVAMVRDASQDQIGLDENDALEWLFGKGLLVAVGGDALLGVVGWQAENLLSVTDLFVISSQVGGAGAGPALLDRVETEAQGLMCEANIVLMEDGISGMEEILAAQGYERQPYAALHRIWQGVLDEFVSDQKDVLVKRLRDRMVMAPP